MLNRERWCPVGNLVSPTNIVFADFESSARWNGFPTEIGWAYQTETCVRGFGRTVAPAPAWVLPPFIWDPESEKIHNLSLSRIQTAGTRPPDLCRYLNEALDKCVVCFDTGPSGFDRKQLDILYSEGCCTPSFSIGESAKGLLKTLAASNRLNSLHLATIQSVAPRPNHQAAHDALHYAWTMEAILKTGAAVRANQLTPSVDSIRNFVADIQISIDSDR